MLINSLINAKASVEVVYELSNHEKEISVKINACESSVLTLPLTEVACSCYASYVRYSDRDKNVADVSNS